MRIRRSKGAFDGFLLILLGLWGGFVPFIGPYFDYSIGSDTTWDYTSGRLWLSILPGAAVVLGGLIVLGSRHRLRAVTGTWLALAGGIWFIVGQTVSTLWNDGASAAGSPNGGTTLRAIEELGFFYGLGALITALAAFALGRLAVRSVRDAAYEDELSATTTAGTATRGRSSNDRTDDRTVVNRDIDVDGDGIDDRDEADEAPRRRFLSRNRVRS